MGWEMVLPEALLLEALAPGRARFSEQAGAEAVPSVPGPRTPLLWQAAGKL